MLEQYKSQPQGANKNAEATKMQNEIAKHGGVEGYRNELKKQMNDAAKNNDWKKCDEIGKKMEKLNQNEKDAVKRNMEKHHEQNHGRGR